MKQKKSLSNILVYFTFFVLMLSFSALSVSAGFPELPVDLGTAGDYVILAESGISTTGTTAIVGDIGVSPIDHTAITGFALIGDETMDAFLTSALVTGKIYAANLVPPTPINIGTSIDNMHTAYTDAQGRTIPDATELGSGDISGMTLTPGLYKWSTGVLINAGGSPDNNGVTLDCNGDSDAVFIFQISQDLTVGNNAKVTLIGNCQPSKIFWAVAGGVSLGTTSDFSGNILAENLGPSAIVIQTDAKLNGRALAQKAVTLDANDIKLLDDVQIAILTTINITPTMANVTVWSTKQFNATGFDQFDNPIAAIFTFNSNDTSIAIVDSVTGLATGVAFGNATITATSGAINATSNITVIVGPTTNATNPGVTLWQNADFNVTLNATGFNGTPISYINYSLNSVDGQIMGDFGNVLINMSGNNTLMFYAVDILGNVEEGKTTYALLDKIAPNITSFTLSPTSVNTDQSITGNCTVTDNLYANITGIITGIDTTSAGSKTATCTATDLAGNIATANATYTVNSVSSGGSGGSGGGSSGGGGSSSRRTTVTTATESDEPTSLIDFDKVRKKPSTSTGDSSEVVANNNGASNANTVTPQEETGLGLITGAATGLGRVTPIMWVFLILLVLAALITGGYYYFRK